MAKTKFIPIKDFGSIYDRSSFIHFPAFYAQLTGKVASVINVFNIDQKPLKNGLLIKYEIGEHNIIESREYIPSLQEMRNVISIVKIKPDLFVQFSFHQNSVDIFFNHDVSKEDVDDLLNFILIYTKKPKEITTIGLIIDNYCTCSTKYHSKASNTLCQIDPIQTQGIKHNLHFIYWNSV